MENITIQQQAIKALDFLRSHPAISWNDGDSLFSGLWFDMVECCKNGKSSCVEHYGIDVFKGEDGWEKWKYKFEQEYKDDQDLTFQSVNVSYEEYYGEKWKFDHVEYWYELTFFVYTGDVYVDDYGVNSYLKQENWSRYSGPMGGATSFDKMLIDIANKVKEVFGDFNYVKIQSNLYTPEETEWMHKKYHNVKLTLKELNSDSFSKNNIDLHVGIMNLRWLKWFMETEYAKEQWGSYFSIDQSKKENYIEHSWSDLVEKLNHPSKKYKELILNEPQK